jgi:hypothetical protein
VGLLINTYLNTIIIPLPDKVYLTAEDVFAISKDLFADVSSSRLIDILHVLVINARKGYTYAKELASSILIKERNPIIFRTYFMRSNEFRARIAGTSSLDDKVRSHYLNMDLPKFIWITEITTFYIYASTQGILGEIIFDSTANKVAVNDTILSIHVPGYLLHNSDLSRPPSVETDIKPEEPYSIHRR